MNEPLDISDVEFRLIRDFLHDRFGIYFKEEKKSFVRMKLQARLIGLGMGNFGEYINYVKYQDRNGEEAIRMVAFLTNNETYFFREMSQLVTVRDSILSEIQGKKRGREEKEIRILSAGCSTGEEAYTLAMMVYENGNFFWGWDVKVLGMDINWRALEVAHRAKYFPHSFRMTDPEQKQKYFNENGGDYLVKDSIKRMVKFQYGNIADRKTWEKVGKMDIVCCRNVFIYFSEEKIQATLNYFSRILRPGGYLLLGHSENFTSLLAEFEPRRFPEAICYRKRGS
ncbi:MAG: methyltransferase domain-containing protein [bacterium]|nr:methyltransferase domain-containing protein [bacterium]